MKTESIYFTNDDGHSLAARLDLPDGETAAFALFAHCFTCGKNIPAAKQISQNLASQGIAVLRFDFTGLGHSEGEFANTNFSSNVADLLAAARHLREVYNAPTLLIGHSLGGAAVLAAARQIPEAKAVATIATPADPEHVAKMLSAGRAEIEAHGQANVDLAGRTFTIKKQFLEDLKGQSLPDTIADMGKALLVMHGPRDSIVGVDNATRIFAAAKHPKSFISLDDADHLISRPEDAAYAATVLSAWASRYIERKQSEYEPTEGGTVRVQETGSERYANNITSGRHHFLADEPEHVGGKDVGPAPYDFLLAGLGACTSMTLRMYAERKGLRLDNVKVELRHGRVHGADCETCETKTGMVDIIEREIRVSGDLTEQQRIRLLEIAEKCPVHRTLTTETKIRSRLVD